MLAQSDPSAVLARQGECSRLADRAREEDWLGGSLHCEVIWDGLLCWNRSRAGELQQQPCPGYVVGFRTEAVAAKLCQPNGTWWSNRSAPWTNFTQCQLPPALASSQPQPQPLPLEGFELLLRWTPVVKRMAHVGYIVSFITLIAALCVLSAIKRLRCPRNSLHKHLFVSFIMRAFMAMLKDWLFVDGVGLPSDVRFHPDGGLSFVKGSNWECKLITSLWQYFIMANYSWILMEGLYLHNLIFLALFTDISAITLYVTLGWGLPLLFVGPWVAARVALEDEFCWTTSRTHLHLLIRVPTIISVLISFGLFLNIVRVLLTKLQHSYLERRRVRYRRLARSTLVLVPLFGVHYTLFLGMACGEGRYPRLELAWLFCDQFFASFQGLFVSLLYGLLNAEVRSELWRKWGLRRDRRRQSGGCGGGPEAGAGCRPGRGASLSSALGGDRLLRMSELGRAGRVRTVSGTEEEQLRGS